MILLVDNYDSFTYNLVHQFPAETEIKVLRNDDEKLFETAKKAVGIVLSPGPGLPKEAGLMEALIEEFYQTKPILGICLGHQAIGEVFGGIVTQAPEIMHGKQSTLQFTEKKEQVVMRYHSLIVAKDSFPAELAITAETDNLVMALKHKKYPVYGLQFHPESIGTINGKQYIQEFLTEVEKHSA